MHMGLSSTCVQTAEGSGLRHYGVTEFADRSCVRSM
jgi:hypothetical protein